MSHADIRIGDVGTVFRLKIVDEVEDVVNISSATDMVVRFNKPDEVAVDKVGTFTTDGADGYMQYVAVDGDLDVPGKWRIQAIITTPLGEWSSEIETFWVKENLDAPA